MFTGEEMLAFGNFAFAWLAVHQIGIAWQDGRLPARLRVSVPLCLGGLAALVGLTVLGPYPVSMVNVPGEDIQNASPPTLALLALGAAQLGLGLLLREPAERWLQRTRPWMAVIAVNAVVFTLFLWHMPAVAVTTLLLHLGDVLPTPPVHSPQWLAWRVPWIALLSVALLTLVAVFGRFERGVSAAGSRFLRSPRWARSELSRAGPRTAATVGGYVLTVVGLLGISWAGPGHHGFLGLSTGGMMAWLAGSAILRLVRSTAEPAQPRPAPTLGP